MKFQNVVNSSRLRRRHEAYQQADRQRLGATLSAGQGLRLARDRKRPGARVRRLHHQEEEARARELEGLRVSDGTPSWVMRYGAGLCGTRGDPGPTSALNSTHSSQYDV